MKANSLLILWAFLPFFSIAQNYERNPVCGTDTITVDNNSRKMPLPGPAQYQAFECTQVSDLGFRIDAGFGRYFNNPGTREWLGNYNAPLLGLGIAYKNLNAGVKFRIATVSPQKELEFDGQMLPENAKLNPARIDYEVSYSAAFGHNIAVEPFLAITTGKFYVINQDDLNTTYHIRNTIGPTAGFSLNKYVHLKDFQFLAIFARLGYGFTNFEKVHSSLGAGYTDISFGLGYKGFAKRRFLKRL